VAEHNPAEWDCCDEHEATFPMGDECPECVREADPAPYCSDCGARKREFCKCPTRPRND
jgi:hypothetical protein